LAIPRKGVEKMCDIYELDGLGKKARKVFPPTALAPIITDKATLRQLEQQCEMFANTVAGGGGPRFEAFFLVPGCSEGIFAGKMDIKDTEKKYSDLISLCTKALRHTPEWICVYA